MALVAVTRLDFRNFGQQGDSLQPHPVQCSSGSRPRPQSTGPFHRGRLVNMNRGLVLSQKARPSWAGCTLALCFFLSLRHTEGFGSPIGESPHPFCYPASCDCSRSPAPARVAIVGGGITGVATAAFLRTLERDMADACRKECEDRGFSSGRKSGDRRFVIDLIEADGHLGGRLDFAELDGALVELGGTDIHSTNEWMIHWHDAFDAHLSAEREQARARGKETAAVSNRATADFVYPLTSTDIPILLHDGDNTTAFNQDSAFAMDTRIWSIGQTIVHNLVAAWTRLYPLFTVQTCPAFSGKDAFVSEGSDGVFASPVAAKRRPSLPAFNSVLELLDEIGLSALLEYRLEDILNTMNTTPSVNSVIDALLRAVYTQGISMHALAGAVSLAAHSGSLYRKKRPGGELVTFLAQTNADHVFRNCRIQRIEERAPPRHGGTVRKTFRLVASDATCAPLTKAYLTTRAFDAVVIAAPLEGANLSIFRRNAAGDLEMLELPPPRKFQEIFVTFVATDGIRPDGPLNPTGGMTLTTSRKRSSGSTERPDFSLFSSWCGYSPAMQNGEGAGRRLICKLNTGRNLTDDDLSQLFRGVHATVRRKWSAYPVLSPMPRHQPDAGDSNLQQERKDPKSDPTRFQLMENIFYPNAFEGAFSCMEGQSMAARNTAHLLWNALV